VLLRIVAENNYAYNRGHQKDSPDCCVHNNLPVLALPVSIAGQNKHLFFELEEPVCAAILTFLCAGYHSIWLPPKVD